MKFTRREFIGLAGLAGFAGCRTLGIYDLPKPQLPWSGGPEGPFTFAVVNDFHLTDARSAAVVSKAVNVINANPAVHFTCVLGDLASEGRYAELRLASTTLNRLERPYYVVPGEHDVDPSTQDDGFENYRTVFGNTQWDRSEGDYLFIGLNTCEGLSDTPTVSEERLAWLRDEVGGAGNKPIILLTHHPLGPAPDGYRVANAEEILSIFDGHNLAFAVSGHHHANSVHEEEGTTFITTAPCSSNVENVNGPSARGFRLFTRQEDGTLTHEFVAI